MLKAILLTLLSINIFALEISLQGAKEDHKPYSTLHIKDKEKFLCQENKNEFDAVVEIVCAFAKSPSEKLQKLQNNFFEIDTQVKRKTFFLVIKPYQKMKLFPIIFDLTKEDTTFNSNVKLSDHWMIIGYGDDIPYLEKNSINDMSIDFPYTSFSDKFPYVGSLDIKGNPVHIKKVGDVTDYIKIKKLYGEKNYDFVLELIDEVLANYPNSLFRAELLFYKIKTFSQLNDNEALVESAKEYLKDYSADENVAEVLSLIARAYNNIGMSSDADYFFDRLFSEHQNSVYAKWGYIYMASELEAGGALSKAMVLYDKALRETDDLDVASEAAFRLALGNISKSSTKEAAQYIEKIVKAKPEYFWQKNPQKSMEAMNYFAETGDYETAVMIAKSLFEHMDSRDEEYETIAKNIGIWLSKTNNKKDALAALNKYIELFAEGMYIQEVEVAKDSLFFDVNDLNSSAKLQNYDKLIEEYKNDGIGNKAIYEKAKLLIKEKKYIEALDMENELKALNEQEFPDVSKVINEAAIGTMKQALEAKECNSVLVISSKYNIELSKEWDDGVYECAMKGADFALAKSIADKNIKSKEINERKKWLYRYIKVDFATGNYSNVIEASKELVTLIKDDKESEYKDVYRYIFDTYDRLENQDMMIESIVNLQKAYKDDYRDIERYVAVISVGSAKKDNNLVIEYGQKVMNIQKASDSNTQSPFVEFALYQAYMDKEDLNKALDVIKSLDKMDLNKKDRSRQKYLLGTVLEKLWRDDDAKKAYQEAIDADKDSAWAELAKSAKEL